MLLLLLVSKYDKVISGYYFVCVVLVIVEFWGVFVYKLLRGIGIFDDVIIFNLWVSGK